MPDVSFTELAGQRVVLRRFRPQDVAEFVAYRSNTEVARYQGWDAPYPAEAGERFIRQMMTAHPDTPGEWFQFAVALRATGQLIGDCAAMVRADDPSQCEIGFTIAARYQGRGYATEAVRLLVGYLFARYAERMMVENQLDAYIGGFHLDALTSGVPLNVDLDTTLTVVAGNLYRLLARKLPRYENATPDRIWRHFLDATGTLHITPGAVTCALNLRSHHPVLIDAGFADLETPIPWWDGRTLRFRFPPR